MAETITPSRMTLQVYKQKNLSARKGHELLKKKCDALKTKIRIIATQLLEAKKNMGDLSEEASLLYAKAQWGAGDFNQKVQDSVTRALIRVDSSTENIAGVHLPNFIVKETEDSDSNINQIGMDRGGQSIKRCQEKFKELLIQLIKIASLQTSFFTLEEKIRVTNRRVNALEYVVIPRIGEVLRYVIQELDEAYREDFGRLKMVLQKKKIIVEQEEKEKAEKLQQLALAGIIEDIKEDEQGGNILNENHDEDTVF